ncbi:MAG: hypothetical protein JW951_07130 [Lentisphaerae bacterium]|nr:hypothetical protein [Lentisphaerota bacterium]
MQEAVFRIYAGERHVDIRVTTEGLALETLLEIPEGAPPEQSVYLREPDPSRPEEIRSFLAAMRAVAIVADGHPDAELHVATAEVPALTARGAAGADGPERFDLRLTRALVEQPEDRRRTLAGNLGLLYSLSLYLFEKKHGIVSYHSGTLVDTRSKRIFVTGGDASSGKSVLMLDFMAHYGRGADQRVLSTEMGHLSVRDGELQVYAGARVDNVALFPGQPAQAALMARLFPGAALPDPSGKVAVRGTDGSVKAPLSVGDYAAPEAQYASRDGYRLVYLMPTIKVGLEPAPPRRLEAEERKGLLSSLIGVARQKLGQKQPSWVYGETAGLFLPAAALAAAQDTEARTIEASLDDAFLEAVLAVRGDPIAFTRQPGAYWEQITEALETA